jgi:hypothetical protein
VLANANTCWLHLWTVWSPVGRAVASSPTRRRCCPASRVVLPPGPQQARRKHPLREPWGVAASGPQPFGAPQGSLAATRPIRRVTRRGRSAGRADAVRVSAGASPVPRPRPPLRLHRAAQHRPRARAGVAIWWMRIVLPVAGGRAGTVPRCGRRRVRQRAEPAHIARDGAYQR